MTRALQDLAFSEYLLQIALSYFWKKNTDNHPQFSVLSVIIMDRVNNTLSVIITDSVEITDGGCRLPCMAYILIMRYNLLPAPA